MIGGRNLRTTGKFLPPNASDDNPKVSKSVKVDEPQAAPSSGMVALNFSREALI